MVFMLLAFIRALDTYPYTALKWAEPFGFRKLNSQSENRAKTENGTQKATITTTGEKKNRISAAHENAHRRVKNHWTLSSARRDWNGKETDRARAIRVQLDTQRQVERKKANLLTNNCTYTKKNLHIYTMEMINDIYTAWLWWKYTQHRYSS